MIHLTAMIKDAESLPLPYRKELSDFIEFLIVRAAKDAAASDAGLSDLFGAVRWEGDIDEMRSGRT
ncbi:MAG: hypothetical protein WCQ50_02940 [Spirochaetota bacterium]